jgi:ATP-binding cassette subfamily F protein uup
LSHQQRLELKGLPGTIERLEAEQRELQEAIRDPALFKNDPARGTTSLQRLQSLAAELETAYTRWEALES